MSKSLIFGSEDGESGRPYVLDEDGFWFAEEPDPTAVPCTSCGTSNEDCQLGMYQAEADPTRACCDNCVLGNTHPPEGERPVVELTPFPDGEGYLEHAWNGLSETMRYALADVTRADTRMYPITRQALDRRGLLDHSGRQLELSDRGQALIKWAQEQGLIT